jgi:hypothetical protein
MIQRTDHDAAGRALLATQYRRQVNFEALVSTYLDQVQELEDVLFDVLRILASRDAQVGAQLDLIGRIVGQAREGRTDADYLPWIQARVIANRASGLPDEILTLLTLVAPELGHVLEFFYPASYLVTLSGALADATQVAALLRAVTGAGIGAQLVYSTEEDASTFTFASGDTEEASTDQGWADDAQTTGGVFADVVEG